MEHLTDDELERYIAGRISEGAELDRIEEHLSWCQGCIDRSMNTEAHINIVKAAVHTDQDKE
jgi:hypothetical protein